LSLVPGSLAEETPKYVDTYVPSTSGMLVGSTRYPCRHVPMLQELSKLIDFASNSYFYIHAGLKCLPSTFCCVTERKLLRNFVTQQTSQ
jgi:hypothetical protein